MDHASSARDLSASPRLFDNPLLDMLSRVDPRVPVIVYGPIVVTMLIWALWHGAGVATVVASFVAGYFIWTLVEYLGHRFLFHLEFPGSFGARLHFLMHGVHHDYPSDPLRLVMPVLMSGPIMALALLVTWAAFPQAMQVPVLAGFIAGYIVYDRVHFLLHHSRSQNPTFLRLKRLHMLHHFTDKTRCYGVAAPWWDNVFRTQWRKPSSQQ
ncbi:sterol desaturase family protein [Roseiarcaceae bacterium H3SJ34-1]|uniref:sterol desaturase family protein n=1 Tax=Terripilifer ovatus TaxID=3032367 RepID=UPI003AB92E10|nr:sterol desaturase family protein [Roseiarcaceae bacterium H3SJ34-1]